MTGAPHLLDAVTEGVVAVDAQGRVVQMNRSAGELLRASPVESVGTAFADLAPAAPLRDALRGALTESRDVVGEVRLPAEGRERVVEMRAHPLDGGAVVILRDVTELRRLETVRQEFVANVSHELKTPVTGIRGFVETMLEDEAMTSPQRRHFLERIHVLSTRLTTLVTDLLALSRLESGPALTEREALDLREPVGDAVRAHAPRAEQKGLRFEAAVPDRGLRIRGDREAVREAADNLLDNAIKYTPAGGAVRLSLSEESGQAILEVRDSGIGIPAEHLDRIFERFYRVDKARSRELGGTGLGLSIVKHVALAHGGRVGVESTPGSGSTFRVWLPLED